MSTGIIHNISYSHCTDLKSFGGADAVVRHCVWDRPDKNEPEHDKTNKMACTPSEDSDQPAHPSQSVQSSLPV